LIYVKRSRTTSPAMIRQLEGSAPPPYLARLMLLGGTRFQIADGSGSRSKIPSWQAQLRRGGQRIMLEALVRLGTAGALN